MEWMNSSECREIYKQLVLSKSSLKMDGSINTQDTPVSGLWSELQKENKFPKGALMMNCELELQELMKQIDKLVAGKKKQWEREKEGLQSRLGVREKECQMAKSTLEQKHKEIGQLRQQLDSSEKKQRDLVGQYEEQLSLLRTEVQNLKREYERLQKRYVKQKKESEKEKEKYQLEQQDSNQEIQRLSKKVEDFRLRSRDWEIDRRTMLKQIESLEAQRKAISEKCEFVQQQAQTYQTQLDKRREILDSTEFSLNSQIAQLEAKLNTASESLKMQNVKVDKLKSSLDEAMSSHKKAMDDNERLLNELKKANTQVRKFEELNTELQAELRARDDFLRMSEEDSKQNADDIALLNKQIAEKDDIIKHLTDTKNSVENEQITVLKKQLVDVHDQSKLSARNEELLTQENSQLQDELSMKRDDCENLTRKLDQKKSDVLRLEEELSQVKLQLAQTQSKLSSLDSSHQAELHGMKDQLSKVTEELHSNNTSVCNLKEKAGDLQRKVETEEEEIKKKDAELKVANAQIDALRLENRHLRQTIMQQTQVNLDHTETETQLREIQDQYQVKMKQIEKENATLKEEVSVLQEEISTMEDQYDQQLQRSLHEAELSYSEEIHREQRRLHEIEEDSDRRVSMLQDRLDSTINRYEEQLQLLRRQKARLEDDLERERRSTSFRREDYVIEEDEENEVMYINENVSLPEIESPSEMLLEASGLNESASEKFLMEEAARARQLESIIDSHIESLKSSSESALKRHQRMQ